MGFSGGERIAKEDVLPALDLSSNPTFASEMSLVSPLAGLTGRLASDLDLIMEAHLALKTGIVVDV
jgi:hypothetical protein